MRIALFDSGYGGLTVLSHARRVLPSDGLGYGKNGALNFFVVV